MNVTCKNTECLEEFVMDDSNLKQEGNSSGNHTTQYLISGMIYCPKCSAKMEINYLSDELDDTGEVLSEDLQSLVLLLLDDS